MPINDPTRSRNVIAFPQRRQRPGAFACATGELMKICAHCGGRLGEDESEDECSSAPVPAMLNAPPRKWRKARSRSSNG
jgi:hypothetical protein